MNNKLGNTVKEQLRNTLIAKEIPGKGLDQQNIINGAVDSVISEFTRVANDSAGRQRLYSAVNLTGRDSSRHEAGVLLQTVVTEEGKQRLVTKVRSGNDLTEPQANNVLAAVSPKVLDALRSELNQGTTDNSAAGLATLLKDNGLNNSVSAPDNTRVSATQSAHASGGVAVTESGNSGLMRFALPILLLGALILGSIKYCSDSEKSRVVAEERSNLQMELADAQEESELQTTKIASLQGEYDSAQSQIGQLQGDLQSSRAEVEALRDVPTDTAELQQALASVASERDAAIDSGSQLQIQLDQVSAERDQALEAGESLTAELDSARAIITDNEESIASIDRMKAEITEITAARDDALERNIELTAANEKLQEQVDTTAPTIADLESQVESLTTVRTELDQQLLETKDALAKEQTDRKAEVDQLTSEVERLETKIAETAPTVQNLEDQVASLSDEKTQLVTNLDNTTKALEEARAARQQDTQRLTAEATDLNSQLAKMLGFRNAAESSLKIQDAKVAEQAGTISVLEEQVSSLETANKEAGVSASLLQKRIDELDSELNGANDNIASRDALLTEREATIEDTNDKLKIALADFDELQKERDVLIDSQDSLQQQVDTLTAEKTAALGEVETRDLNISDLKGSLQSAISDVEASNEKISALESSLETEQSKVAELESANVTLEQDKTALQKEFESASGKIEALDKQLKVQGDQLQEDQQTIVVLNKTVAELKADASELTKERDDALGTSALLEKSLTASDIKITTLTGSRDTLQSQIDSAAADVQARADETLALREIIEQQLVEAGVTDASVQSIEDNRSVAITLGSGNLYQTGMASLTREGGIVLAKIGNILSEYTDWRIDVEGHTDSLNIGEPLRQKYPTNWELSSARASAAVRHMKNVGGVDAKSLSVSGFGDTRPIADNSDAKGREKNRRVDIILRR